jgi:RHS repeat-associated protein
VRLVVDIATGAIAQRMEYDAFGNVLEDTNPGFQPFGYAGGIHDRDTGLVRFGARDYDPEIGRWVAKDAIGFAGHSLNFYLRAGSDPTNRIDVSGFWSPEAHDTMIQNAFEGHIGQSQIDAIKQFGRDFDASTQSPSESHKHAMRGSDESIDQSRAKIEEFIQSSMDEARSNLQCGNFGPALHRFSEAAHTIMDRYSPMHTDEYGFPRKWNVLWPFGHSPNESIGDETKAALTPDVLSKSAAELLAAYNHVFSD